MKKYILILSAVFLVFACKKDKLSEDDPPVDPYSLLVNGVYQYPTKAPDSSLTSAQKREYWDIPEDVLPCLTTGNLLISCLNHPFIAGNILIHGCCGLQSGYELQKNWCRGMAEFETRPGALDTLIARYMSIDTINYETTSSPLTYGGYNFYTYCLEVFLAQEVYLSSADTAQKIDLLTDLFVKQNFRKEQRGWFYIEGPSFVMARIMYYDNYLLFIEKYNQNADINYFVLNGSPMNYYEGDIQLILLDATDYLNSLKTR